MKKLFLLLTLLSIVLITINCSSDSGSDDDYGNGNSNSNTSCGTYNGKTLHKGPQGGCYYINSSGNKEYVDRSLCNC